MPNSALTKAIQMVSPINSNSITKFDQEPDSNFSS